MLSDIMPIVVVVMEEGFVTCSLQSTVFMQVNLFTGNSKNALKNLLYCRTVPNFGSLLFESSHDALRQWQTSSRLVKSQSWKSVCQLPRRIRKKKGIRQKRTQILGMKQRGNKVIHLVLWHSGVGQSGPLSKQRGIATKSSISFSVIVVLVSLGHSCSQKNSSTSSRVGSTQRA